MNMYVRHVRLLFLYMEMPTGSTAVMPAISERDLGKDKDDKYEKKYLQFSRLYGNIRLPEKGGAANGKIGIE